MKKVYLFEKTCCGPSQCEELVKFLKNKFRGSAEIKLFNLNKVEGKIPIPPSLLLRIEKEGARCLPAMVVDGGLVCEGGVPNFMDAVQLVRTGQPSGKPLKMNQNITCCD